MKENLIFIILFFFLSSCQTTNLTKFSNVKNDEKYIIEKKISKDKNTILMKFDCDNEIKSIVLPNDVIKTFNVYYEEGYYKNFIFSDKSSLTILCGCCATIIDNKQDYTLSESIEIKPNRFLVTTFHKSTKRFTQTNDYIQAENLTEKSRKEFERIIINYIRNN